MKGSFAVYMLAGLLGSASAGPEANILGRAACNRDNCLRQVVASNAAPGPAVGSADCKSFFATTISPCAATVTATAAPSTITSTTTSTVTTPVTSTIATVTPVATATATTTETVTVTAGKKRDLFARAIETDGSIVRFRKDGINIEKRTVAATCTAGTITPSSIPTYASSCRSPSQYSSACSCDGVTGTKTTLATPTSTVTTTPKTTITVTVTSTSTSITSITATAATATTTTTVTVTSTVTVNGTPTCTKAPGTVQEGCQNGSICNASGTCRVAASQNDCFNGCLNDPRCIEADYDSSNSYCDQYEDCC